MYVYAYTDGEPPSQLTVSFGLLGVVVSTDNPITVRSQSDLQSDHSPIICFTTISHYSPEKNLQIWKGILFFLWKSQVAGKIYDRTVIGLWSDCRSDCDRTVVGLLHGAHARASSLQKCITILNKHPWDGKSGILKIVCRTLDQCVRHFRLILDRHARAWYEFL